MKYIIKEQIDTDIKDYYILLNNSNFKDYGCCSKYKHNQELDGSDEDYNSSELIYILYHCNYYYLESFIHDSISNNDFIIMD